MPFQRIVNNQPGVGEPGDFYGTNPRAIVIGGPGAFRAPASGLRVGHFFWVNPDTGACSQSFVPGYQIAFLGRSNNAVITQFLGEATMVVLEGLPVTPFEQGDFWAEFDGAQPGEYVFADAATGAPIAGPADGAGVQSFEGTGTLGFGGTAIMGATFTGVVAVNVLTVTALTGTLHEGDIINGAGVAAVALGAQLTGPTGGEGTYTFVHANVGSEAMTADSLYLHITAVDFGTFEVPGYSIDGTGVAPGNSPQSQDSGTPGGIGVYIMANTDRFVSTATLTQLSDTLNITAVASGVLVVGAPIAGGGLAAGTTVDSQTGGTPGGIGTYITSQTADSAFDAATITSGGIATPWRVNSAADSDELAIISTWG